LFPRQRHRWLLRCRHASAQARLIFDTQMLQRSDIAVVADEFDGSPDVWSAIGRNRGTQLPGR
jgi:hypothetical protein